MEAPQCASAVAGSCGHFADHTLRSFQQAGVLRVPILQPILSVNEDPEGQHLQQQQGGAPGAARPPADKPAKRLRYYVRLYVNGRLLDASEDAPLDDDFVAHFKDTFR